MVATIDCVVSFPGVHKFEVALLDVNVTLPPEQNVKAPLADMVGVAGIELTVTIVAGEVAEHPLALVTLTV